MHEVTDNPTAEWPRTEQEERLDALFDSLGAHRDIFYCPFVVLMLSIRVFVGKLFKKIKKANNPDKIHGMVKEVTAGLKEAKG